MRLAVISLFLLATSITASAQECFDYGTLQGPDRGTFPCDGTVAGLDASAANLCVAVQTTDGDQLEWTSVAGGPEPVLLGSYLLAGRTVRSLHIAGTRAAVALTDGGWMVVDFADPAAPVVAGELAGVGCQGVDVQGDWVYAAEGDQGLGVYELGGGAPVERARLTPGTITRVDADGDRCCIAGSRPWQEGDNIDDLGYKILVVLDLADPGAPVEIGRREYATGYLSDFFIEAVHCSGASVLMVRVILLVDDVVGGSGPINYYYQAAVFFDSSSATDLADAGGFGIVNTRDVAPPAVPCALAGTRAYLLYDGNLDYWRQEAGTWMDAGKANLDAARLTANADGVWGGRDAELQAMAPTLATESPFLATVVSAGSKIGGSVQVASLQAVNGELWLGVFHVGGTSPSDVPYGGIRRYDMSDPLNPVQVGEATTAGGWIPPVDDYVVAGDYLYAGSSIWNWQTGVQAGTYPLGAGATLAAFGDVLWCLQHNSPADSLKIYDISNPVAPVLHGSFPAGADMTVAAVDGDRAVLAGGNQVVVVDAADPRAPAELQRATVAYSISQVIVDGTLVVVANGPGVDVLALDRVSGMLTPVGRTDLGGQPRLAYDGTTLYTVVDGVGLSAVDVTTTASPQFLGAVTGLGATFKGIAVTNGTLYVSDPSVEALQLQCTTAVPVAIGDLELVWADGACRLSWTMDARLGGVRVLASAGGRSWVVPWENRDGRNVAVDGSAPVGTTVVYAVQTYGESGWTTVAEKSVHVPASQLTLSDPVPNPFNPETALQYSLDRGGDVELVVFDAAGRHVRTLVAEPQTAGPHTATWRGVDDRGRTVPAGVYFALLRTGAGVRTTKLMLLK